MSPCACGCGMTCRRTVVRGHHNKHGPLTERFWARVEPEPNSGCWLWLGAVDKDGYGKLKERRHHVRASRIAYSLATGVDPGDRMVLHSCDMPRCVNPAHLSLGDNRENQRQKAARGRAPHGETHACAKVTEIDVAAIREQRAVGASARDLAVVFGIHRETVRRIGNGRARAPRPIRGAA